MIDNYMKYIENLISPKTYSVKDIQNHRGEENFSEHSHIYLSKLKENESKEKSSNVLTHSVNSYSASIHSPHIPKTEMRRSSSKSILSPKTIDIKKLSQNEEETKHRSNQSFSGVTMAKNCDDVACLKEIIKEEKKKNMNLRHEINELHKQIQALDNREGEFSKAIQGLKIEKDMNTKYVLKMEAMIYNLNKNQIKQKNLNAKNLSNMPIMNSGIDDNFLREITEEMDKLKHFKNEVFRISRCYDEVNGTIIQCLREIHDLFNELNNTLSENMSPMHKHKPDFRNLDKIRSKYILIKLIIFLLVDICFYRLF
jgi:hypothetical protein